MLSKIKYYTSGNNDSLFFNTIFFTIGEILLKIITFFIFIVISRKLSLTDFGDFNFILAFASFFLLITDFGTNTILFKHISSSRNAKTIDLEGLDILNLKKILIVVTFISCILTYFSLNIGVNIIYVLMALIYLILKYIGDVGKIFYRGNNQFKKELLLKIFELICSGGLLLYLIISPGLNILNIFISFVVIQIFISGWYINNVSQDFKINLLGFNLKKSYITILKKGFFFGGAGMLAMMNFSFDQILLKFFGFTEELGLYAASFRLVSIGILFMSYIFVPIFPKLVKSHKQGNHSFIREFNERYFFYIILFGVITIPIIYYTKEIIVYLILGEKYISGVTYFFMLYVSFILIFLREPSGYSLTAMGKQKIIFYILLIASIFNLGLNFFLIPLFGALGASISTIGAEVITCLAYIVVSRKYLK